MKSKNYFLLLFLIFPVLLFAKKVEISTNPSDAEIYVNGKLVGTGSIVIDVKNKECITVQIVREGYLGYSKDYCNQKGMPDIPKRDYIQLNLDQSYEASTKSDIANVDVVLKPQKGTLDENWTAAIRTITDYFDALEVSDSDVKYLRSAWIVDTFDGFVVRTRIIYRLTRDEPQEFKLKIVSERAPRNTSSRQDERFEAWDRVLKKYGTLLEEVNSRIAAF
ncbi:MAG: PEGA domain-containing protein [Flavobacteriaceae bacterium]|nr:PEGA domain-containing protein [Flavobacteriaceae bacterium]